jgi:replicative DNA helicase
MFLSDLFKHVSTTAHIRHYAATVKRNSVMRLIRREMAKLNPATAPEELDKIMQLIHLRDTDDNSFLASPKTFIDEYFNECEQTREAGIRTGYPTFDRNFHAQDGDLIVVAARANVGKTVFSTNVLVNLLSHGTRCLYCPTEMRPKQFMGRIMPLCIGVPATTFRSHQFTPGDISEMRGVGEDIKAMPLHFLDMGSPTINEIKRAVRISGCKVLFVDYLGRCSMTHEQTRMREIERFVVELKNECLKSGIICFLAVQLSRRTDFDEASPKLADLSDSSAIEKEADAVLFLWREAVDKQTQIRPPFINIGFGKNRFGYTPQWTLDFNRVSLRMTECGGNYAGGN